MAIQKSILVRNAEMDALAPLANNGFLRIYTGLMPDKPEYPATGRLLAELRFNDNAFSVATNGIIRANPITADTSAAATGQAGYYRAFKSDGNTALWDGTVGTDGADLELNSTAINVGINMGISSLTVTCPQG